MACNCHQAKLKSKFRNCECSKPVGGNSISIGGWIVLLNKTGYCRNLNFPSNFNARYFRQYSIKTKKEDGTMHRRGSFYTVLRIESPPTNKNEDYQYDWYLAIT